MSSTATDGAAASLFEVGKRYGATVALNGLNLSMERGRVTALLGPNGAGKSTAVALVLGLASPDAGRVELFGASPGEIGARQRMGVMLQSAALQETLRVGELLRLTSSYYPHPAPPAQVAEAAGIADLLNRFYGKLSGGQQRRVQFALAICGDPDLLCLDEPTVGLDTESRASIWDAIRSRVATGCAVLLTTHYLEEAEAIADRVAVLVGGRLVVNGSVDEVRSMTVRQRIRCVTSIDADAVRRWAGVNSVIRRERRLEIETSVPEQIVRRLLDADPAASELEVRRGGLAEALAQIS